MLKVEVLVSFIAIIVVAAATAIAAAIIVVDASVTTVIVVAMVVPMIAGLIAISRMRIITVDGNGVRDGKGQGRTGGRGVGRRGGGPSHVRHAVHT